jgi:PadR family transcriptional regulator PadR
MGIDTANLETEMNRGFLQILTLVALQQKTYGYKMLKSFEQLGYSVEENTLYPILRRLEKNGWVKSEWEIGEDRPKKYYRISPTGRQVRDRALSQWNSQNEILRILLKENSRVSNP